MIWILF